MFRRRRPRVPRALRPTRPFRPIRGFVRRGIRPLAPAAIARLAAAHRALSSGEFARAAALLLALADAAESRGLPRAAALHLEAGLAFLRSGQGDAGLDRIRRGLRLAVSWMDPARFHLLTSRVLSEVEAAAGPGAAEVVRGETAILRSGAPLDPTESQQTALHLPPKCPQCGGTVHPGEVEWVEGPAAICDYCGSLLSAEGKG
jgi:hypothetical protein